MLRPPLSRREFEVRTRRLIAGDATLTDGEVAGWELGRDWLAWRLTAGEVGAARRRSPRLKLSLSGHIAGTGGAFTDDLGFFGLSLRPLRPPRLGEGDEASVRLTLAGRSIYLLGKVVWLGRDRLGVALGLAHPSDERALQAAVCNGYLEHFVDEARP
jgi:hypothetical protein